MAILLIKNKKGLILPLSYSVINENETNASKIMNMTIMYGTR